MENFYPKNTQQFQNSNKKTISSDFNSQNMRPSEDNSYQFFINPFNQSELSRREGAHPSENPFTFTPFTPFGLFPKVPGNQISPDLGSQLIEIDTTKNTLKKSHKDLNEKSKPFFNKTSIKINKIPKIHLFTTELLHFDAHLDKEFLFIQYFDTKLSKNMPHSHFIIDKVVDIFGHDIIKIFCYYHLFLLREQYAFAHELIRRCSLLLKFSIVLENQIDFQKLNQPHDSFISNDKKTHDILSKHEETSISKFDMTLFKQNSTNRMDKFLNLKFSIYEQVAQIIQKQEIELMNHGLYDPNMEFKSMKDNFYPPPNFLSLRHFNKTLKDIVFIDFENEEIFTNSMNSIQKCTAIGIDCERYPAGKNQISILQIATFEKIYIFDILKLKKKKIKSSIKPQIRDIFCNKNIIKIIFKGADNLDHLFRFLTLYKYKMEHDQQNIKSIFDIKNALKENVFDERVDGHNHNGFIDNSYWISQSNQYQHQQHQQQPYQHQQQHKQKQQQQVQPLFNYPNKGNDCYFKTITKHQLNKERGLHYYCKALWNLPIDKYQEFSNWNKRPLRENQMHYAAFDGFILLALYKKLLTITDVSKYITENLFEMFESNKSQSI